MRLILSLVFVGIVISASAQWDEAYGYEFIPDVPDSVIESRLGLIEDQIALEFTETVKQHIQFYTVTRRDYARKMLNRSSMYFPLFERKLAEHGLPDQLKYLSIVESGLNSEAMSHAAAVGLWQFIYSTGKIYGLESDWYIDDRMDPEMATEAACRYLKYLFNYFNDWELALAGYNSGPGRVNRAIRYAGGLRNFWDIYNYLPNETKAYVPKFVAVTYVFNFAEEHNLFADEPLYWPEYDTIQVSQYLHLETFMSEAGICAEDMERLNPQIKHAAIPERARNYPVRIPADMKEAIEADRLFLFDTAGSVAKAEIERMAAAEVGAVAGRNKVVHTVRSGDVLGSIAERYDVRVSDIKRWNRMSSDLIRIGQNLSIWLLPNQTVPSASYSSTTTRSSTPPVTPRPGQKVHFVQEGDTLWDISVAHNVSIENIKSWNNLTSDCIRPGQTLIVEE